MSKEEKIRQFVETERDDYTDFIKHQLEDRTVSSLQAQRNQEEKKKVEKQYEEFSQEKKWMPNGLFGEIMDQPPYQELDFEAFSFNVLQHLNEDQQLNETVDIIKQMPETKTRKELRIYLFESLRDPRSPYFDIQLYYDIREKMDEANSKVEKIVEENGKEVLTKGFDSHSFIASDKEAKKIQRQANQEIQVSDLQLESKASAVKFYNIAHFQERDTGEWYEVMTNGTPYDNTKREVVKAFKDKEFQRAYEAVSAGKKKHLRLKTNKPEHVKNKFKEYTRKIREIEKSEEHREK
jgi:hypothetical protein